MVYLKPSHLKFDRGILQDLPKKSESIHINMLSTCSPKICHPLNIERTLFFKKVVLEPPIPGRVERRHVISQIGSIRDPGHSAITWIC